MSFPGRGSMAPEARGHNLARDPFGLKVLAIKYDVLFSEVATAAGRTRSGTPHQACKVSAAIGGYERHHRIEQTFLDALRKRGATVEELAPAIALGFGQDRIGRGRPTRGYVYRPIFDNIEGDRA